VKDRTHPKTVIPLGKVIRHLRRQRHLSVRGLADKCGFSASFISQVELGQAEIVVEPPIPRLDELTERWHRPVRTVWPPRR